MHLRLDGQVYFYRWLFSDAVKPPGCISWPLWPLRGINKTAWGSKVIQTEDLAFPVSCASMGHQLMAQHCPNVCFSPPMASHPPHLSPTHPPPIDSIHKSTKTTSLASNVHKSFQKYYILCIRTCT